MSNPNPIHSLKPKILVVDDSRVMRYAFNKILGNDFEVVMAENGEVAWDFLINDELIKVVFSDLSMPVLDGNGLLLRIRQSDDERISNIPVVIITGKEDVEAIKRDVLAKGANDFIAKPFDTSRLRARAASFVNLNQTHEKLKNTEQKLLTDTAIDEVTGLGSKRYFDTASTETLAQLVRHGGKCTSMLIHLDNLDNIQETHGKTISDALLRTIGLRISSIVRTEDKVARIDDTTFGIFLVSADLQGAQRIVERLCTKNNKLNFTINAKKLLINFSIGIYEPNINRKSQFEQIQTQVLTCLNSAIELGGSHTVARSDLTCGTATEENAPPTELLLNDALAMLKEGNITAIFAAKESLFYQLAPLLKIIISDKETLLKLNNCIKHANNII